MYVTTIGSPALFERSFSTPRVLTYSTRDVIDNRISIPAQHSLVRLSKNPATSADAVGMLEEVKAGRLAGIYCVNWEKAALRAQRFGKHWWTAIPLGEDAVLMLDPDNPSTGPPLIAFRRELDPDCGLMEAEKAVKKRRRSRKGTPVKHPSPFRVAFVASPSRLDAALRKAWLTYSLWDKANSCRSQLPSGIPITNVIPPGFCWPPDLVH